MPMYCGVNSHGKNSDMLSTWLNRLPSTMGKGLRAAAAAARGA
jgi:hypothetical protein